MCEDSLWRSAGKLLFELICQFKWELESEMLNQTGGESSHTANEKQGENKSHSCKNRQKPVNSKEEDKASPSPRVGRKKK